MFRQCGIFGLLLKIYFLSTIILAVLVRFTASDLPIFIFKLFFGSAILSSVVLNPWLPWFTREYGLDEIFVQNSIYGFVFLQETVTGQYTKTYISFTHYKT